MPTELGDTLAESRGKHGWTLRDVEGRTGIHNAHLSQIEKGTIARPDPNILWELARIYERDFDELMRLAGHVRPGSASTVKPSAAVAWRALEGLTPEQQREALDYLQQLRKERDSERAADQ